jgi:hypothetical protein
MRSRSAVLEGASQVHARTFPWRLAEACLYSIQSGYVSLIDSVITVLYNLLTNTEHRRCSRLSGKTVGASIAV